VRIAIPIRPGQDDDVAEATAAIEVRQQRPGVGQDGVGTRRGDAPAATTGRLEAHEPRRVGRPADADHARREDQQPGGLGQHHVADAGVRSAAADPEAAIGKAADDAAVPDRERRFRIQPGAEASGRFAAIQGPAAAVGVQPQPAGTRMRLQLRQSRRKVSALQSPASCGVGPHPGHRTGDQGCASSAAGTRSAGALHQRRTRGPSQAPRPPLRRMPSVYQTATNAAEASGQASA